MSYDYEFAKVLKSMSERNSETAYSIGTVEQVKPLIISLYDGEIMAQGKALRLTETLSQKILYKGDRIAVIGQRVFLAIDKVV